MREGIGASGNMRSVLGGGWRISGSSGGFAGVEKVACGGGVDEVERGEVLVVLVCGMWLG